MNDEQIDEMIASLLMEAAEDDQRIEEAQRQASMRLIVRRYVERAYRFHRPIGWDPESTLTLRHGYKNAPLLEATLATVLVEEHEVVDASGMSADAVRIAVDAGFKSVTIDIESIGEGAGGFGLSTKVYTEGPA